LPVPVDEIAGPDQRRMTCFSGIASLFARHEFVHHHGKLTQTGSNSKISEVGRVEASALLPQESTSPWYSQLLARSEGTCCLTSSPSFATQIQGFGVLHACRERAAALRHGLSLHPMIGPLPSDGQHKFATNSELPTHP
jgi:hypothetical protein